MSVDILLKSGTDNMQFMLVMKNNNDLYKVVLAKIISGNVSVLNVNGTNKTISFDHNNWYNLSISRTGSTLVVVLQTMDGTVIDTQTTTLSSTFTSNVDLLMNFGHTIGSSYSFKNLIIQET